jgi:hypothetical protein
MMDFVSVLLALAWLLAISMAIALFSMVHHLGTRYAFTAAGLSRMGPHIGQHLAPIALIYRGKKVLLRQLISHDHPTLLVFLNHSNPSIRFVDSLVQFVSQTMDHMSFLIFCKGVKCEEMISAPGVAKCMQFVDVGSDDPMLTNLVIRTMPYAVLIDSRMIVIAKGLVNNTQHICMLTDAVQSQFGMREKEFFDHVCLPYLAEIRQANIQRGNRT